MGKCLLASLCCIKTKCASLLCTPAYRRFLLTTISVYFLTFCVILPLAFNNLPLTKYYHLFRNGADILREAKDLTRTHADLADEKLASFDKAATKQQYEETNRKSDLKYVIGVITIPRPGTGTRAPRYLTQVMVALHEILQHSNRMEETGMFICNTQRPPANEHHEAIGLSQYFPMVHSKFDQLKDRYEKEKEDYVFCLREAQKLSPKYVLLLQDDALPHPDFYSVMSHVLRHRVESQLHHGALHSASDQWLWLKLNFPNSLAKYERNYFFALEWICLCIILASMFTLIIPYAPYPSPPRNGKNGTIPLFAIFPVIFAYFLLFTWVLGKPYINLPRSLSKSFYTVGPGTSCCLPAVLFPQSQIPSILAYLQRTKLDKDNPLDFALDDYREESNLRQFLINPNLFSHIGVTSALHGKSNTRTAENYLFILNYLKWRFPKWPYHRTD